MKKYFLSNAGNGGIVKHIILFFLVVINCSVNTFGQTTSSNIDSIWVNHGATQNNQSGMLINIKFTINGMQNRQGICAAWFYFSDGTPLKINNSQYSTPDGSFTVQERFNPIYDNAVYNGFKLFMPYSALNMINMSIGSHNLMFMVGIFDHNNMQIASSSYQNFNYNKTNNTVESNKKQPEVDECEQKKKAHATSPKYTETECKQSGQLLPNGCYCRQTHRGTWAVADKNGNNITSNIYESIVMMPNGSYKVENHRYTWAVLDSNGKAITGNTYAGITYLSNGDHAVYLLHPNNGETMTIVDLCGKVITRSYDCGSKCAELLENGNLRVQDRNGRWSVIDQKGNRLF